MDIGSVIGNAATGGVLGGLFSLGNAAVDFVNRREEAKEKVAELSVTNAHELEMTKLNAANTLDASVVQGKIDEMKASFDAMKSSIEDQSGLDQKVTGPVLDIIALFRPGLTIILVLGTMSYGYFHLQSEFNTFVELTAMAVAWWFGDRQRMKLKGN